MTVQLYHGDCLDVMASMEPNSVDAIVTDPPYGLAFMGKDWDHGVPGVPFWKAALRVAKPGAHLLAFGGTRTFHRLAVAIEDAGWGIRDTVMWVYGSGFPKSHDVSKAIDKSAGAEREVVGTKSNGALTSRPGWRNDGVASFAIHGMKDGVAERYNDGVFPITAPATPAAAQWAGWGTALKPAVENVILARKPFDENTELSIIVGNLLQLEAQLWLLLPANIAEINLTSSLNGYGEAFAIARWTADEPRSIQADLCAQMDMSQYEWAIHTTLNTVSSWRNTWEEALRHGSTFTTKTVTSPIISLQTLNSSVLALTPRFIIQAAMIAPGSWWSALPAASVLSAVAGKLNAILELSAIESAIDAGHAPRPDAVDQGRLSRTIIVARKPLQGTVAANVLAWGTGAINVDGCRVGDNAGWSYPNGRGGEGWHGRESLSRNLTEPMQATQGRWPANVTHDGSDEVLAGFPVTTSGGENGARKRPNSPGWGMNAQTITDGRPPDTGSAARFFYVAKASKADRDEGLEGLPLRGKNEVYGNGLNTATKLDPALHTAESVAARPQRRNHHPTVKPTALMRWLVRLVTRPGGVVLDPFMGSGSTGKAAVLEGMCFIGIEQDAEYLEIARRRIDAARLPLFAEVTA